MTRKPAGGLSDQAWKTLIDRAGSRPRRTQAARPTEIERPLLTDLPGYRELKFIEEFAALQGIRDPYFRTQESRDGSKARIDRSCVVDFTSYDYLGLNTHPRVLAAAKEAIDRYGVSASASPVTGGSRPIHGELEEAIARLHGAQACVTFVSGHATNVSVLGQIAGPRDLIVCDERVHNSVLVGAKLSGARRHLFPHNDAQALDDYLVAHRRNAGQVFIVIESHYSMDGDVPDLAAFADIRDRHRAWLMVDEAHALGVLGATGRGIAEHAGVDPTRIDLWMGTLSKTLAGCGGYIAGAADLVRYLRRYAPGHVYSVAMPPPVAAASRAAIEVMETEPDRLIALRARAKQFGERCREHRLDTGTSIHAAIIPILIGGSVETARVSEALFRAGFNAQPIMAPAVPDGAARLRFFITCQHSQAEIEEAVAALSNIIGKNQNL